MRDIALQCPALTEIQLSEIWSLSYRNLLECLKLHPKLEVLQIHNTTKFYDEELGKDDHNYTCVLRISRILETVSSHNRFLHTRSGHGECGWD